MTSLLHLGRVVFTTEVVLTDPAPISINAAYTTFRNRRILTDEGRAFKDALAEAVSRSSFEWKTALDTVRQRAGFAELSIALFFKELYNASWRPGGVTKGKGGGETRPQNPYQPKDASNYIKLIEDAVVKGSGIDDANTLAVHAYKWFDTTPRVELIYQVYEPHTHFHPVVAKKA